jgi:hypothetical protein
MATLKDEIKEVSKSLSDLNRRLERIAAQVAKQGAAAGVESRRSGRKGGPDSNGGAGVRRDTVLDSVYGAVKRSRNGISIAQLKGKTELGDRQLSNALYKLTKKGMIQAKARGVYVRS